MINQTHILCFTYILSMYIVCCLYWYGVLSGMVLICEEIVLLCAIFHSPELYTDSVKMCFWVFFLLKDEIKQDFSSMLSHLTKGLHDNLYFQFLPVQPLLFFQVFGWFKVCWSETALWHFHVFSLVTSCMLMQCQVELGCALGHNIQ